MILEQKVKEILQTDMPELFSEIQWNGMFDKTATKIVKAIKEELVR